MVLGHGPSKAFNDVKATITKDVVLAYPDFSREFETYTDALSKQLGSVITQGNTSLAFFSQKSFTVQKKRSVTELELLAIVDTKRVQRRVVGTKMKSL